MLIKEKITEFEERIKFLKQFPPDIDYENHLNFSKALYRHFSGDLKKVKGFMEKHSEVADTNIVLKLCEMFKDF